jgi:hypothetical protein
MPNIIPASTITALRSPAESLNQPQPTSPLWILCLLSTFKPCHIRKTNPFSVYLAAILIRRITGAWFIPGQQFDLSPLNLLAFAIVCVLGFLFEFLSQHIIAALLLLFLCTRFWRITLRNYSSASP